MATNSQGSDPAYDQERIKAVEDVLYALAIEGNLKACQYWLEMREPARWGEAAADELRQETRRGAKPGVDVLMLADLINRPLMRDDRPPPD
jgi:hypothetical protein